MAPSRRKGSNKAAAAAAARRKWKVGDLVLAKVKGFPAWPAAVSEPEKWGYSVDWRKVVVQFFGCEQIAFCNPADVEEFTEEKKVSLLGKRHGKGADFVRAVNEIIDCFEKVKKQEQVSRANGTEGTNITSENTEVSLNESVKDDDLVVKPSTGTANDLNSLTEAAVAAAAEDALHENEMRLVEASSNLASSVTPASSTYTTRNKTDVAQSRKSGSQKRKSARVLRSSSRIDASKLQSVMPSTINTRSSRRSKANLSEDRSLRRSKRIFKSSDDSVGEDADSLAFVSNYSIEDSDSEIMTVDSDTLSVNDGTTINSGIKPVESEEPPAENNEGETEMNDRLDFQSSNVIIKKKRKPSRKRHKNDTVEAAKHDIAASDAEMLKTECASPTSSDKSAHRYVKDDGDEHLPLVKRARVRKGRASPAAGEEVALVHNEEKTFEVPQSLATQSLEPLCCKVEAPAGGESVPIIEDPTLSSFSHVSPAKMPILCETRKNFVDEEAALPPSKRLHRALEAMSANVAEDCERASNCSPAADLRTNGYCPSFTESSELPLEKKAVIEMESGATEDLRNGGSLSNASEFCTMSNVATPENDSKCAAVVSDCVEVHSNDSKDPELCRDSFECVEGADSKWLKLSLSNEAPSENDTEHCVKPEPRNVGEHLVNSNCNTAGITMSSSDLCMTEQVELNVAQKSDPDAQMNPDSNCVEETAAVSPSNATCVRFDSADDQGDEAHTKNHWILEEKNDKESKRSEIVEEASSASLDSNIILSVTPVKVLSNGHHSAAISNNHVDDRTVSITQSSTSLTDRSDTVARASPPSSSICNLSVLNISTSLENNSSSSPDVQLHLEKAKHAGRYSCKGESLSSFEAIIRSLTRTKESIGRATRIAIDCAKLGFATKVVEMLAHNLESESSLPKKVDLFFLVDSITQCSRGIKGDGGVYPSAIQAVLPRLLLAAAPPGSSSHENHRQCLKVLRVWQERKILPEPIIRHHIRELDALCGSYPIVGSQRPLRNERAFDDPIREMEGMLVDEYGSNSSIQLPGFCMPPMLRDDDGGSDSDGESFEAVTPEHNVENHDGEKSLVLAVEKRSHILEDVDGELEMEDVAPCCEVETTSTSTTAGPDHTVPNHQSGNHYGSQFPLQQPKDAAPTSAPLSRSPRPPPPPPHAPLHPLAGSAFPHGVHSSVSNGRDTKPYSSCQNFDRNFHDTPASQSVLPRVKPTAIDNMHHRVRESKDFEAQMPRPMPDSSNACSFSDRPTSHLSSRASNSSQRNDAIGKGFHLRPPHPAPSNQFSYVQEQRIHSRRDIPPPSHSNRFHTRNAENGNFYRDRGRNKFVPRDNIGECWRPPFSSISGPCYPDDARMGHAPMSYNGPPRDPPLPNNRWNYPPRPMNQRHFNNYRPPSEGPVPVANRGPGHWRPR